MRDALANASLIKNEAEEQVYNAHAAKRDGKRLDRPATEEGPYMWTPQIKMIPIQKMALLGVIGAFINLPQAAGLPRAIGAHR